MHTCHATGGADPSSLVRTEESPTHRPSGVSNAPGTALVDGRELVLLRHEA